MRTIESSTKFLVATFVIANGLIGCSASEEYLMEKDPDTMTLSELGEASAYAACQLRAMSSEMGTNYGEFITTPKFSTVDEKYRYEAERDERFARYHGALIIYPDNITQLVFGSYSGGGHAVCQKNGHYNLLETRPFGPANQCYLAAHAGARIGIQWFKEVRENADYAAAVSSGLQKHCGITVETLLAEMAADPATYFPRSQF